MKNLFISFFVGLFLVVVTDAYKLLPLGESNTTLIDTLTEEENEDESETKVEKDDQLMDMVFVAIKTMMFPDKIRKQKVQVLTFLYPRFPITIVSPPPEA